MSAPKEGEQNPHAIRTVKEIADILAKRGEKMTRQQVWHAERKALKKIADALAEYVDETTPRKRQKRHGS